MVVLKAAVSESGSLTQISGETGSSLLFAIGLENHDAHERLINGVHLL